MARTVDIIYADLVAKKEADERLNALSSTSKVAIWRLWLWIFAYGSFVLETLFDKHREIIEYLLSLLKPHTLRWYRNKVLSFQYGFDLITDTDVFVKTYVNDNGIVVSYTDEQIEASKIIKYAAVTESATESRLIVKVATEKEGVLAPIEPTQNDALVVYLEEIKDAGNKITVVNYLPDILKLEIQIFYDALVLDENGISRITGKKPVEDTLRAFMKQLPFNGELVLQTLTDRLQLTEGVAIVNIVSAQSKWIDNAGVGYGNFENINVKKIAVSGYFQIENFDNITYVV